MTAEPAFARVEQRAPLEDPLNITKPACLANNPAHPTIPRHTRLGLTRTRASTSTTREVPPRPSAPRRYFP